MSSTQLLRLARMLKQSPSTMTSPIALQALENRSYDPETDIMNMSDATLLESVHIPGKYQDLFKPKRIRPLHDAISSSNDHASRRTTYPKIINSPDIRALDAELKPLTPAQQRLQGRKLNRVETYIVEIKESPQFYTHLQSSLWDICRTTLSFKQKTCYIWWSLSEEGKRQKTDPEKLGAILDSNRDLVQATMGKMAMRWHGSGKPMSKLIPQIAFRLDKDAINAAVLDGIMTKIESELSSKAQ